MADARVTQTVVETLTQQVVLARVTQVVVEVLGTVIAVAPPPVERVTFFQIGPV